MYVTVEDLSYMIYKSSSWNSDFISLFDVCAMQVLMRFMEVLSSDSSYFTQLTKKLAPPLVTLLSAEPEIQFVALRNINLIVQKR